LSSALTHLLRVIQCLLLCTALTFSSTPARASVVLDQVVAVDERSQEQSDHRTTKARALCTVPDEPRVALELSPPPLAPLAAAPPRSPIYILTRRLLR
jgi:hypothetical protein